MFEEVIAPLFSTPWGRRSAWAMLMIFSLLLLVILIQIPLQWRADLVLTQGTAAPLADTPSFSQLDQELISRIPEWHLFGNRARIDETEVPITSLQLHLVGVIYSAPENVSRIIISEAGKPGKVYQVGDILPGGVRVDAITLDGVILKNGERFEKLPLQRPALLFKGMPKKLLREE